MKTICLYSAQLHLSGGIESVIRDLYRILPQGDIRVVAACEYGKPDWIRDDDFLSLPQDASRRAESWRCFLFVNAIDCVVFNHVAVSYFSAVFGDIRRIRTSGVKCVMMCHSSFVTPLLVKGEEEVNRSFERLSSICDAVFTVSQIDAIWWAALGYRALKIQNPVHLPAPTVRHSKDVRSQLNVLWVGRFSPEKQPEVALAVFARAHRLGANIHLTMIGCREQDLRRYQKMARNAGVERDVEILSARRNIGELWQKADIHLLTSMTESFSLVLAEAKMMGIPTVMFDIPYIELTASKKGLVSVRQGDDEGMAAALVELSSNQALREQLGRDALDSFQGFDERHVLSDWRMALDALDTGKGFAVATDDLKLIVSQMVFAWERYCRRNLWLVRMQENARRIKFSFRDVASALAFGLNVIRKVKVKFRLR